VASGGLAGRHLRRVALNGIVRFLLSERREPVWVKLDDRMPRNPKVRGLSDRAFRAYIEGLCHCGEQETNGHLDRATVKAVARPRVVEELLAAGLWIVAGPEEFGIWVKDYLDFNPSREDIRKQREATAARQRKWRERHADNA
jgi:hypothetical protein